MIEETLASQFSDALSTFFVAAMTAPHYQLATTKNNALRMPSFESRETITSLVEAHIESVRVLKRQLSLALKRLGVGESSGRHRS